MRDAVRLRKVRLAKPYFSSADLTQISKDIRTVLESGWLTTGKYAEKLERRFTAVTGTKRAVSVNSGTAALHVMMAWLHLRPEDEVIVPANTFASTANAVLYERGKVVLADCDSDSFNVTADTIAKRITERTRAVIVTHVGGNPCEMKEIVDLCDRKGVLLFEDAAHAIGSRYQNQPCGSFGWGAAFSLYPTKVITSAEGGMITTNSDELAEFAQIYRNMGRRKLGAGPVELLGHNYRLSDVHAVIGLNQLARLSEFVSERNKLAGLYAEGLGSLDWVSPQAITQRSISSFYSYIIKLGDRASISRDELMARLAKSGVETTVMFRPVHTQPFYREFGKVSCPNAEMVGNQTLVLPMHTAMTKADVSHAVSCVKKAARR